MAQTHNTTIFKTVGYALGGLVQDIGMGKLGLPDIQRPFVWRNVKVRDLFDSMYKGYPVGHLLFWENGFAPGHHAIGTDAKQLPPELVIVDGQQRLTALFAVMTAAEVVRSDYSKGRIRLAFNPLDEKFEVTNAAIERDRAYIADISQLWSSSADLFELRDNYLEALQSVRDVTNDEVKEIQKALTRLQALSNFPFTAQQLDADVTEEDVAEVFVRINSTGKTLNQADFILTLMSVFWDEGRTALEDFCRLARNPIEAGSASPYNHFIQPKPDQMLRVGVGLAFKRARLHSIYSILRGKDLETDEFSEQEREAQFQRLKLAQAQVLDLQHWHDFLQCLRLAGFRRRKVINSDNALLFSYTLYLIGRTEIKIAEHDLRPAIAQWFFMASLTGRYTGSPESAMESDLAMLRNVADADEFLTKLRQACAIALTDDFWTVTLPNELATSAASSPSLSAVEAALVVLDAPVLFSQFKVAEMVDPIMTGIKTIERHHLFPKGHLAKLGVSSRRDMNQIANYAFVEWFDNGAIGAQSPAEYLPVMEELAQKQITPQKLNEMYRLHALPAGWTQMEYGEFLKSRRELIARVIREGYEMLSLGPTLEQPTQLDVAQIIAGGEADRVEFKSTLRVNLHTRERDPRMENAVIKTIAGFLNTHGGTLIIGVADDGNPVGIDADGFANEDKMSLHLTNLVNNRIGAKAWASIHANFEDYGSVRVLSVRCEAAQSPSYVEDGKDKPLYIRAGTATVALPTDQIAEYVNQRFG